MSVEKQLDFYFSNQNYFKDTFLRNTCENEQGIEILTIAKFKKLEELNASEEEIKEALKNTKNVKLENEKLVKVKDDSYAEYILRKHEDYMVVIDGFDLDTTFEEIETHLSKFMKPKFIRMKKKNKKDFTGAVLVELDSLEEAKEALNLKIKVPSKENKENVQSDEEQKDKTEPAKKVKLNQLTIKTKAEYQENLQKLNQNKDKHEYFISKNQNKVFKFETEKEYGIQDVKKMIKNVSFVDLNHKILRFKHSQDKKEMEFEDIKLTLLPEKELKEYVENVVFANKTKKKSRK